MSVFLPWGITLKMVVLEANFLRVIALVKFLNAVKSLCTHYLFNQWLEFDQTSTVSSLEWGKEGIRFW